MITLNGNQYRITYVDDCDIDFSDPAPGSTLSVKREGELDTLTRPYRVQTDRKTYVQTQLARLKGKKDFEFGSMFLYEWSYTEDGAQTTFNVTFKGLYDNKLPEPKITGSINNGTITVGLTNSDATGTIPGSGQRTIVFEAPTLTAQYVSRNNLDGNSRYWRLLTENPALRVDYKRISGGTAPINIRKIVTRPNQPVYAPQPNEYNIREVLKTKFSFEKIGPFYQITETNEIDVQPYDMASAIRYAKVAD